MLVESQKNIKNRIRFSVTIGNTLSKKASVLFGGDMSKSIKMAKFYGYDAVELQIKNPQDVEIEKVIKACKKFNINVSAIATGSNYVVDKLSLTDDSDVIRNLAICRLKEYVDLASIIGGYVIVGCMRGNIPEESLYGVYESRLSESMKILSEYAGNKNVMFLLEAINRYENNYLNTAYETLNFIKKNNITETKILLDTFHMNIEEKDIYEGIRECKELLGYLHISDSNRMYAGAGHIDFKEVAASIINIGFEGYLSAECLPIPNGDTSAQKAITYMKSLF